MHLSAWMIWLAAGILLTSLELAHGALVAVWFGTGCFFGAIAAGLGAPVSAQVAIASIASLSLLFLVRPLFHLQGRRLATNAEAIVGRRVKVLEQVGDQQDGVVLLTGEHWKARSMAGTIAAGSEAQVVARDGMLLMIVALDSPGPG